MNRTLPSRRALLMTAALVAVPSAASAADPYRNSPWRSLSPAEWRSRLPPAAFAVMREEATERARTSVMLSEHRAGTFLCRGCDLPLFRSEWKYESRTGWPSFFRAIPGALGTKTDLKIGVPRTEYHCARCLGHQGHVFNDGPAPTGLRYCNNGVALKFQPR